MTGRAMSFAGFAVVMVTGASLYVLADERPNFTATPRLHGEAYRQMRDAAFARAGVPTSMQCHENDARWDCMILDHIRPLCAGGTNAPDNLQLQRRDIAAEKDRIERAYCEGRMTAEQVAPYFKRTSP